MDNNKFNPLIPKAIGIEEPQNTGTSQLLFQIYPKFTSPLKTKMTAGTLEILRNPPYSPNPSGRETRTKEACTSGVKSIALNDRGCKLYSDVRTAVVFCL
ncbi:hypothetical protein AVEN_176212-1 [Araneus ventricosus]|uniref:Uncharacterized protein n=1 Tax=Araneus ventricosus TaxID=182803 RepID=A0A4Y2M6K8_ARAVE|nr:hypothetical protein AVEN_176212-1 [Araneus ventricosus]